MEATDFDELEFFRRIAESGARALLIGRRALVLLGLPLVTGDYDYWIHTDDIAEFNRAVEPMGLYPNRPPEKVVGQYVLENDEHVDVYVARNLGVLQGREVTFDEVWLRRERLEVQPGTTVVVPTRADLIAL